MNSLQATSAAGVPVGVVMMSDSGLGQRQYALIGDSLAFDQPNSSQFGEGSQLLHAVVGQAVATG